MNLYEKNMQAKEKSFAAIVELIEPPKESGIRVENLLGPRQALTARVEFTEGKFVFMHSMYDPFSEAERMVRKLDFSKHSLIFVFGLGLCYHLFEIQKHLTPLSQVLVFENDLEVIENAFHTVDFSKLFADHRFVFCFCLSEYQVIQYFRNSIAESKFFYLASNSQFLSLNYYERRNPGFCSSVVRGCIEKLIYGWNSLGNCTEDTIIGLAQNFYNIDVAIENPGVNLLAERYKDKPAILVAAGPSLDKNIGYLKEAQGRALIIACDVVVGKLLKHGIRPDIMVSLERVLVYDHCLKDRDWEIPEDMVLAAPILIEPLVFKEFKNNKKLVCFKEGETINIWLNKVLDDKGTVYMGNSVAHLAFGLAIKLGANPIIFTGQDLAFAEDGKTTHTGELREEVTNLAVSYTQEESWVYLDGYYSEKVKSTMMWKNFKIAFENVIERNVDKITFIDATEGGAKIEGTLIMPLREVIDTYCTKPIERFYDVVPVLESVDKQYCYGKLLDTTAEKVKLFKQIMDLAKKQREAIRNIKARYQETHLNTDEVTKKRICSILSKTDDIFQLMKKDLLTILFFQGIMSVFALEVLHLGLELSKENIWGNLVIQEEFLNISIDACFATLATLNNLQVFIKDLAAGSEKALNYDNYLKIVVT